MSKISSTNYTFILVLACLFWSVAYSSITPTKNDSLHDTSLIPPLPDFAAMHNVNEKKVNFFDYLYPLIKAENNKIANLRTELLTLRDKSKEDRLNTKDLDFISSIASKYLESHAKLDTDLIDALLEKVDTVPASIALAQAAIESAWGTSRFAKAGNNLFGQWCFKKGCGIIPLKRSQNQTHEVAKFSSVNESVRAYMHNLNSFSAYSNFRRLRKIENNKSQDSINSLSIIDGLMPYSEQASNYVKKVKRLITSNNLKRYDHQS